jgi:hypothetical protein
MGTTESLLYDDQPPNESDRQPRQSVTGSPSGRRRVIDNSSKGGSGAATSKKPNRPITRMSGVLVGGPKVGKRTLLQRLQGKDPYAPDTDNDQVPTSVTMPYLPPAGMPTWNRIQLQVGRIKSDEALPKVDFMVVLIRPSSKESLEEIQSHTLHVVRSYLQHLEYSQNDPPNEDKDTTRLRPPACICVMINFRDLLQDDEETNSRVQELEQRLEVFLKGVLKQYAIPKEKLLLQFISTSLLNCYGLNRLHNFIYRTYLQKKQEALEAQLRAVTLQIQNTGEPDFVSYQDFVKLLAPLEPEGNMASRQTQTPSSRPSEQAKNQALAPSVIHPNGRASESHRGQPRSDQTHANESSTRQGRNPAEQAPHNNAMESQRGRGKGGRRQLYPQVNQPARVGKDALEAFLASDSSDDDDDHQKKKEKKKKNQRSKKKKKDRKGFTHPADSSDDDDDDFFYDESGRFNNTKASLNDDASSSSDSSSSEDGNRGVAGSRSGLRVEAPKTKEGSVPKQKEAGQQQSRKPPSMAPVTKESKQQAPAETIPRSNGDTRPHDLPPTTPRPDEPEKEQTVNARDNNADESSDEEPSVHPENGLSDGDNEADETQEGEGSTNRPPTQVSPPSVSNNASTASNVVNSEDDVRHEAGADNVEVSRGNLEPPHTQSQSRPLIHVDKHDDDPSDDDEYMVEKDKGPKHDATNDGTETDPEPIQQHPMQRNSNDSSSSSSENSGKPIAAALVADDDSDDDELFIGDEDPSKAQLPSSPDIHTQRDDDSDDEDDEFFIEQDEKEPEEDSPPDPTNADPQSVAVERTEMAANPTPSTPPQVEESSSTEPRKSILSNAEDDSDDEDEFFVGGDADGSAVETKSSTPSSAIIESSKPPSPPMAQGPPSVEQRPTLSASSSMTSGGEIMTTTSAPSSGISAVALAAIQAAQKEAEAMLLQSDDGDINHDGGSSNRKPKKSKKEKKSKKDGSEKKKKKKKDKSKSDRVVLDDSD